MHKGRHQKKSKIAIVAIAASAGGVTAIRKVLSGLPKDFPVPILCLQHLSISDINVLAQVLQLRTNLTVRWAHNGEELKAGVVYVCPPGHYFVVHAKGKISLAPQASKHGWVHGVDRFFESVAESYADSAVVIVMTGTGKGGAEGVRAVSGQHGIVLAQDRASSVADGMPEAAIATGCVDRVLSREAIAPLLVSLVCEGKPLAKAPASKTKSSPSTRLQISPTLVDALENVLDRAIAMHRTDMGYIHLFERQTCSLALAVQRGFDAALVDELQTVSITEYSPCIRAVRSGETVIVEDVEVDPLSAPQRAIAAAAGYRAVQSTPLTTRTGTLVGVLSTHFRQPRKFLPWEMKLLDMHARHAGDLIELFQAEKVG
ncbi:MAG: chemotaxis protein CheB [Aulosira sp. ZfuVER01]|nr:chemotaxis protein CheB [Aulosira sp. ZfuVER01]MDZ8002973.1 chemotaxis protein CheB [Aulosira sp. DedVER01a]MDZ8053512.1 chemotaxis protein CheB [Aulosira sp. ZfuCHP01]